MSEYYIGLMSGTSMDAVDAALVKFEERAILEYYREYSIDPELRTELRQFDENSSIGDVSAMDIRLGHLFAEAVNKLIKSAGKTTLSQLVPMVKLYCTVPMVLIQAQSRLLIQM